MTKQVILAENHYLVESSRTEKSQFGIGLARIRPQCVSAGGGSLYVSAHLSCPACHGPQLPLVHRSVIPSGFSEKYNSLEFGGFNNFIQKVFIPCISLSFYQLCAKPNKHFLAVQDSSIGDLVTHSVSQ